MAEMRLFCFSVLFALCMAGCTLASDGLHLQNLELMWVEKPMHTGICDLNDVEQNLSFVRASIGMHYKNLSLPKKMDMDRIRSLEQKVGSFKDTLGPNINYLCKKRNIKEEEATKLSLIVLFKPSWNVSLKLLEKVCGSGGLTHQYTLEEALFVLLMLPQKPNFLKRMWSGESYKEERIFYFSCLAGAVAYMLGFYKKISKNFFSAIEPSSDKEQMLIENVSKLKDAARLVFEYGMLGKPKNQ